MKTIGILKELNNSGFFKSVEVSFDQKNYFINVKEFSSINKFVFKGNKRIKDEDINNIIAQMELFTFSEINIYK